MIDGCGGGERKRRQKTDGEYIYRSNDGQHDIRSIYKEL